MRVEPVEQQLADLQLLWRGFELFGAEVFPAKEDLVRARLVEPQRVDGKTSLVAAGLGVMLYFAGGADATTGEIQRGVLADEGLDRLQRQFVEFELKLDRRRSRYQLAFQGQPSAAGHAQAGLERQGAVELVADSGGFDGDVVQPNLKRRCHRFVIEGDAEAGERNTCHRVAPGRRWCAGVGCRLGGGLCRRVGRECLQGREQIDGAAGIAAQRYAAVLEGNRAEFGLVLREVDLRRGQRQFGQRDQLCALLAGAGFQAGIAQRQRLEAQQLRGEVEAPARQRQRAKPQCRRTNCLRLAQDQIAEIGGEGVKRQRQLAIGMAEAIVEGKAGDAFGRHKTQLRRQARRHQRGKLAEIHAAQAQVTGRTQRIQACRAVPFELGTEGGARRELEISAVVGPG